MAHKKPKLATSATQSDQEKQPTTAATDTDTTATTSDDINNRTVHPALRAKLEFDEDVPRSKDNTLSGRSTSMQKSENLALNSSEMESSCIATGKNTSGDIDTTDSVQVLECEKRNLEAELKEKKEKLRKLKMIKMYRTKNNLQELATLTARWREVAQEAAETLLESSTHQPRPSMAQMLDYMHIDHQLIQYSDQDECFY